jgi:hypothetical protein
MPPAPPLSRCCRLIIGALMAGCLMPVLAAAEDPDPSFQDFGLSGQDEFQWESRWGLVSSSDADRFDDDGDWGDHWEDGWEDPWGTVEEGVSDADRFDQDRPPALSDADGFDEAGRDIDAEAADRDQAAEADLEPGERYYEWDADQHQWVSVSREEIVEDDDPWD